MSKTIDLTGKKFNKLTILYIIHYQIKDAKCRKLAVCLCECGVIVGPIRLDGVVNGHSKSCGCLRIEKIKNNFTKHGYGGTPEYKAWWSMLQRCSNPKDHNYLRYGGRGIKVCPSWIDSCKVFIDDMGYRPSSSHSLDRIDNNGDYHPTNCRWATKLEQINNRSTTVVIKLNGIDMTLGDAARLYQIDVELVRRRLKSGWDVVSSLTRKARSCEPKNKLNTV